jgi:hypothetical protein
MQTSAHKKQYKNGLVLLGNDIHKKISEAAYFKWLSGSTDSLKNWLLAEKEVLRGLQ